MRPCLEAAVSFLLLAHTVVKKRRDKSTPPADLQTIEQHARGVAEFGTNLICGTDPGRPINRWSVGASLLAFVSSVFLVPLATRPAEVDTSKAPDVNPAAPTPRTDAGPALAFG